MPKKLSEEIVIKLFESKGFKLLEQYKSATISMLCEKDGYWYHISYNNLRNGKNPSLWSISNFDNFEHNIKVLFEKRKIDSVFLNVDIVIKRKQKNFIVTMQCPCGNIFKQNIWDLISNVHVVCPKCQTVKRGKTRRKTKESIEILKSKGYKILDKRKDFTRTDYIEVEDSLGYKGFIQINSVLHKNSELSRFDIRVNKKYYIYNVNHYAELRNWNVKCLGFSNKQYQTKRQGLIFQCFCGNIFETSIPTFQNGKTICSECAKSISKYEKQFKNFLEKENVEFIYQYSFNQCRDILPLPFDFYLPKYDVLIEIDGEGHYHPCNFNQINEEKAKESFYITKKHDKIKDDFCQTEHKKLIRIPYFLFQNNTYQSFFYKSLEANDFQ